MHHYIYGRFDNGEDHTYIGELTRGSETCFMTAEMFFHTNWDKFIEQHPYVDYCVVAKFNVNAIYVHNAQLAKTLRLPGIPNIILCVETPTLPTFLKNNKSVKKIKL